MGETGFKSLQERFEHLFKVISSERFLARRGLGNEVPFFISPFSAKEAADMGQVVRQLVARLQQSGVRVLEINLYDLSLELLEQRSVLDQILENEAEWPKEQLKELLQGPLDPEQHLIPAIASRMAEMDFDVMFLTGVGEVYPYIRSHTVLNNLQSTAKDKPTVMFFPGTYTHTLEKGASLDLFGRLHDDKYYRAFNIDHYEV